MSEWKYLATLASFAGSANRIRRNFRRAPRRLEIVPLDGGGGGREGGAISETAEKSLLRARERRGGARAGPGGGGRGEGGGKRFAAIRSANSLRLRSPHGERDSPTVYRATIATSTKIAVQHAIRRKKTPLPQFSVVVGNSSTHRYRIEARNDSGLLNRRA